jgi:hypothetical protein
MEIDTAHRHPFSLACDECGAPADRIHILSSGDRPERIILACEAHDPGGEWWFLTEVDDLDRAMTRTSSIDDLRPGISDALGAAHDELMTRHIEIPCSMCRTMTQMTLGSSGFSCARCGASYSFRACSYCGQVDQARSIGRWRCSFCGQRNTAPRRSSALRRQLDLDSHYMTSGDPDIRLLGGFTHVGGAGFRITPGSICSLLSLAQGLRVTVEISERPQDDGALLSYEELTALELGGGARTRGGAFVGGGFGLRGAWEGMLAASVLNALTTKTTINTGIRIGSTKGELLLHHGEFTPEVIRNTLSPVFNRFEVAGRTGPENVSRSSDPVGQLERLAKMHRDGSLTDEEFAAAKQRWLNS